MAAALAEPFGLDEVRFKPQSVKGNRALAVAYIDNRHVQERLDDVVGPDNWQDDYEILPSGSVKCRLSIRINGEWVPKTDVGSPSEQPDAGDKMKAAFSDAMKRAAVKWGIGRYLYRLAPVWCDYDPMKKQFTQRPQMPDWAKPKPQTHQGERPTVKQNNPPAERPQQGERQALGPPQTPEELTTRMRWFEAEAVKQQACKVGEVFTWVGRWCSKAGFGNNLGQLDRAGVEYATACVKELATAIKENRKAVQPPVPEPGNQPAGRPNGASMTVRAAALQTVREWGDILHKTFDEPLDTYCRRECNGLTYKDLESDPKTWTVEALSALAKDMKTYVEAGVPY